MCRIFGTIAVGRQRGGLGAEAKMMDRRVVEGYWRTYLATLSPAPGPGLQYVAVQFGDSPELADRLGASVVNGSKTATCSALCEWEAEGEPLPSVGSKRIVLDGGGIPLCVVETTEVTVLPLDEVGAAFAKEEGEGDLSLQYWREAHRRFFSRTLPKIGREASPDMPLVCERFRVVYR